MNQHDVHAVAAVLRAYPACLIVTHVNPEGDAIGSQLALAFALEQLGVSVSCFDRDGVPETCRFLPGWERVATVLPAEPPPLVVYVDAASLERCGVTASEFPPDTRFLCIDHHHSEIARPTPSLVDVNAAAAGELVYSLLSALEATLTPEIATCLHTALMVDTGRFSYTNTTPNTLRIAAELIAGGADLPTIVEWIWGKVSLAASLLSGVALSSLETSRDGRIGWAVLRARDFHASGASQEDTEGIIDNVRNVKGVQVAALFSEKDGVVRVSLRSRGEVDVAQLAKQFQGGGHVKAAGMSHDGPMEYAIADVLRAIEALLPNLEDDTE